MPRRILWSGIFTVWPRANGSAGWRTWRGAPMPPCMSWRSKKLALPADPLRHKLMADGWWAWAESASEADRDQARRHAAALYRDARGDLAGLTLDEVNRRIRVAEASSAADAPRQDGVNALALVDVTKDAVEGVWALSGGVLSSDAATHARLQLPVRAGEEYDLSVTFTRTEGSGPVVVLLTGGGAAFGLALDVKGHEARFEAINHKVSVDNPTRVDCALENDRRYVVTVRVRKDAVTALLDGKPLTQWKTDYKDLSRYDLCSESKGVTMGGTIPRTSWFIVGLRKYLKCRSASQGERK